MTDRGQAIVRNGNARRAFFERPRWFLLPLGITLALLPVFIFVSTPKEHLAGAALAYVNLLIIGAATAYFVQQRTLQGLIPVLFLTWFAAGWPLPTIYFATRFPDGIYVTMTDAREFLFNSERVQLVTLAFLLSYLGTFFLFGGRYPTWTTSSATLATDRRLGTLILWIVIGAITLNAFSKVVQLPDIVNYMANGAYNYLHSLMLMVGVLFLRVPMRTRLAALLFMALAGGFYFIGNARGMAALPAALFLVGLIFFSEIRQSHKMWTIIGAASVLPIALVIGNTTRALLGSIGFSDLEARVNALSQWQEVLRDTPVLVSTFHRLYFVAGHSIIALTPERFQYLDFSLPDYLWEMLTRLIPGKLFYDPYYSSNYLLTRYGFRITEETSFPLSLLGSLYMLGGFVPVIIGAFAIGLFHVSLAEIIARAGRRSRYLGLFLFSMIATMMLWSQNVDLITNVRAILWRLLWAFVLYFTLLRPFVERRMVRRRVLRPAGAPPPRRRRPSAGALPLATPARRYPAGGQGV